MKTLSPIFTELFLRGRKLNISPLFTSECYFKKPKTIRVNTTHYFIWKIPTKRELQQIALNHSSNINCKGFIKFWKDYATELYSFLVNNATLLSDNPLPV